MLRTGRGEGLLCELTTFGGGAEEGGESKCVGGFDAASLGLEAVQHLRGEGPGVRERGVRERGVREREERERGERGKERGVRERGEREG